MASHNVKDVELKLGPTNIDRFLGDPKRMAFFFSRYKFAAKMLSKSKYILDIGCGDGMGAVTFLHDTPAQIIGVDWEEKAIKYARDDLLNAVCKYQPDDVERLSFVHADFWDTAYRNFDGLCCLDMIEHIEPGMTADFVAKLAEPLNEYGVAVVGTPNERAAEFGSVHSKIGHINLFGADRLRYEMEQEFRRVFMFSMNDSIVHDGSDKMAFYLMAVGVK